MFRGIFSLIMAATVVSVAMLMPPPARGQQVTPGVRQALLPYIRATTDCMANAALSDSGYQVTSSTGNWRPFLQRIASQCATEINQMIATHDRLVGPGTGLGFLDGPYMSDLPRAIQKRAQDQARKPTIAPEPQTVVKTAPQVDQRDFTAQVARTPLLIAQSSAAQTAPQPAPVPTPSNPVQTSPSTKSDNSFLGWIIGIGLLVFGVPALVRNWLRKRRIAYLMSKYHNQQTVDAIMARIIWQNMSKEQVIDAFGYPVQVDKQVMKTKVKETYKYGKTGVNRFSTRITIENDLVVGWQEK